MNNKIIDINLVKKNIMCKLSEEFKYMCKITGEESFFTRHGCVNNDIKILHVLTLEGRHNALMHRPSVSTLWSRKSAGCRLYYGKA